MEELGDCSPTRHSLSSTNEGPGGKPRLRVLFGIGFLAFESFRLDVNAFRQLTELRVRTDCLCYVDAMALARM